MPKWCDEGENLILNVFFKGSASPSNIYLGIYKNNSEPAEGATLSDLTEPNGYGYSRAIISQSDWTVAGSQASTAKKTFTATGGDWGNCYGYFLSTSSDNSGKLLGVEQFSDGPYNITDGDSIEITPKIYCS